MNSFTKKVIDKQPITHNIIQMIAKISEYKILKSEQANIILSMFFPNE